MTGTQHIAITGAGLVGSLLAIYLRKRGYRVSIFERRPDPRKTDIYAGRSINLALSNRGLKALQEVGLEDATRQVAIPMHGRMVHDVQGKLSFQPYGKEGQFINSISRSNLNNILVNKAEKLGAHFYFEHRCTHVDLANTALVFDDAHEREGGITNGNLSFDYIIGSDGAFSSVRLSMQMTDRFNLSQRYIEHGYKELHIPATETTALEKQALHIWPRESYMLIALPNADDSFTCTLFLPFEGPLSFESLKTKEQIDHFFKETFPDAYALMPTLLEDFATNPTASLVTIKCFPWVRNRTLVIGDAAHAIVPFYGQGMNAGFEDCRILNALLDTYNDRWEDVLPLFQQERKPNADAIAALAMDNFIEMRDLVADKEFLVRKKIEARLHELFPRQWIPLYSMVTFHEQITYAEAYAAGQKQKMIMDRIMTNPDILDNWQALDFRAIVEELKNMDNNTIG